MDGEKTWVLRNNAVTGHGARHHRFSIAVPIPSTHAPSYFNGCAYESGGNRADHFSPYWPSH
jgi:hypothetical protein